MLRDDRAQKWIGIILLIFSIDGRKFPSSLLSICSHAQAYLTQINYLFHR